MAGKIYTEPIQVVTTARVADGSGGYTKGSTTIRYNTVGVVKERSNSRYLGDSSINISKSCDVELWRNPNIEITAESKIEWRGSTWRIMEVRESDDRLKYFLKITK